MALSSSTPRSGIGTLTSAVRPSRETSTAMSPRPPVTSRACSPRSRRRSRASASRSPAPVTTSSASSGAPGNAFSMACCAITTGSWSGRLLEDSAVFMSSAGTAIAPRMQTVATIAATGRRVTTPASRPQAPMRGGIAARRRARRRAPGSRPRSIRSPSSARTAGSTVTEPSIAMATTNIVPSAMEVNTGMPVMSRPASATMTVTPEITTARPTVAAVAFSAACGPRPLRRSSRSRRM